MPRVSSRVTNAPTRNPYLFVGARNEALGDAAMSATRRRRNAAVHCMRPAFSTWAHEQTAHSNL